MPYPDLLCPEPLPLKQSTADLYLLRKHSNTVLSQSLWGLWVLVHTRYVWALWASLVCMGFDSKHDFAPPTILLGLLFTWTMNFQMFKLDLENAKEPEIKLPTSVGSLKKQEFQKNIYFYFIDYAKAFGCVDHNKLWSVLKEMEIPDHFICLLRNLYAGQEATVRTRHQKTNWSKLEKSTSSCIWPLLI